MITGACCGGAGAWVITGRGTACCGAGCSGARTLVTLIHALRKRKLKKGIVSLCLGGGEAVAMAIESL